MKATHARVGVIHVHSRYSHDGRDSPAELRQFMRDHDIGFLALSDHAEDVDPTQWAELVEECARASDEEARIIPGLEFRFAGLPGLHLLALGLQRWLQPATPGDFIAQVRGQAALTVVAHPGLARYVVPPEVAAGIDAIEVWNGAFNTRYLPDPQAIALLRRIQSHRPEVVGTVGLDQHDARNDRQLRVIVDTASHEPLAQLRSGRFRNQGRTMAFGSRLRWSAPALWALTAARRAFDGVEGAQDWWARRRQRMRGA
jgi:predicted metal-dependent phosphoesterase TrpH